MGRVIPILSSAAVRFWTSFSYVGLAVATVFFAASMTPSLLPRHYAVQGILSGFAIIAGYAIGVIVVELWLYLEIPQPSEKVQSISKPITSLVVIVIAVVFLWRATVWQNSIRELMEMDTIGTAYPWRVALIAAATSAVIILLVRAVAALWRIVDRKTRSFLPRRVSIVLSGVIVVTLLFLVVNNLFARLLLNIADEVFLKLDEVVDDGVEQVQDDMASGSPASLIKWDEIGRYGKEFVAAGPTKEKIGDFWSKEALRPLRVYVGLGARDTVEERAKLALDELIRVGGFDRSVLVIATPTGTGWLDPGGVDTIEYLHAGDIATVTMQYSYMPSWLTILVDPTRSIDSSRELFDVVYEYWKTLPKDDRPKLYVYGLSLGAMGSAASTDIFTIFEDPIQGGLWSGPPFPSTVWTKAVHGRNADSSTWLPTLRDGSMLRFTGRQSSLRVGDKRWGPMRFVYIQHASDPMCFFSTDLLYKKPEWLANGRGPDVSPYLKWRPVVTFLQVLFDIPMATTVPHGYGHNYAASTYIDSWIEVTTPPNWTDDMTERLKKLLKEK